jgi:Tfp pilus assembly protein PilX
VIPRPQAEGERGVALLYALVFTMVIGLLVTALLGQSSVQFRAADAYRQRRNSQFAADAGLEQALSTIGLFASSAGSGSSGTCTTVATCPVTPVLDSHKEAVGAAPVTVTGVTLTRAKGMNRLVVVATGSAGATTVADVTFNGVSMHRATTRSSQACWFFWCWGTSTEVWYALDAELPATAGTYNVKVTHGSGSPSTYAVHASTWAGVLQDIGGVAYVPTSAGTHLETSTGQISTTITAPSADTLLLSSVGHGDDDVFGCGGNDALTGVGAGTRLTNGPNPSCAAGMGTSYAVRAAGAQVVTETFAASSSANAQAVLAFRPASSAPAAAPVFGAACIANPIHLTGVNGNTVDVVCTMTSVDVLTISSVAVSPGRTVKGKAVLNRRSDGRVDVTSWDIRPDAPVS